jgi:Na+/citrate or Na+/malate symporter
MKSDDQEFQQGKNQWSIFDKDKWNFVLLFVVGIIYTDIIDTSSVSYGSEKNISV